MPYWVKSICRQRDMRQAVEPRRASPTKGCSGESRWLRFFTVSKYLAQGPEDLWTWHLRALVGHPIVPGTKKHAETRLK